MNFSSELDDPIQRVFLVLRLSETNEFEKMCPLNGYLQLYRGHEPWVLNFAFRDVDWTWHTPDGNKKRSAGYNVSLEFGDKTVTTQNIVFDNKFSIPTITVPVPLWSINERPFKVIRDFNNAVLVVGVSSNLTVKLTDVEFIVNGWALFHADTKTATWRPERDGYTLLAFKGDESRPPIAGFELSLHDETFRFYPNLSGTILLDEEAEFMQISSNPEHWNP